MSDERDVFANRRAKMESWLQEAGGYVSNFRRDQLAAQLHATYADADKAQLEAVGGTARIAGRVMLRRVMGKASFVSVQDRTGAIQAYVSKNALGDEAYQAFTDLCEIGDIVGIAGVMMRTNKGELTVDAREFHLLNKTLRPLPEKFHGLTDQELRYRQRYVDLIVNEAPREVFKARSNSVSALREFFAARDYLEVETPMMHSIPGVSTSR